MFNKNELYKIIDDVKGVDFFAKFHKIDNKLIWDNNLFLKTNDILFL